MRRRKEKKNLRPRRTLASLSIWSLVVLGVSQFKVTNMSWITWNWPGFKLKSMSWVYRMVCTIAKAETKNSWSSFARNYEEKGGICLLPWRKMKLGKVPMGKQEGRVGGASVLK